MGNRRAEIHILDQPYTSDFMEQYCRDMAEAQAKQLDDLLYSTFLKVTDEPFDMSMVDRMTGIMNEDNSTTYFIDGKTAITLHPLKMDIPKFQDGVYKITGNTPYQLHV